MITTTIDGTPNTDVKVVESRQLTAQIPKTMYGKSNPKIAVHYARSDFRTRFTSEGNTLKSEIVNFGSRPAWDVKLIVEDGILGDIPITLTDDIDNEREARIIAEDWWHVFNNNPSVLTSLLLNNKTLPTHGRGFA